MKQLSSIIRPKTLSEIFGQDHIKPLLEKIVNKREFVSLLLYGNPGIGKTSLAYALCNDLKVTYSYFNAATQSKKDLVNLIELNDYLIIDEIHRLNKDKQDLLLPALERDKIKIIATTTENPYFVVNPAVRSRLHILELKLMTPDNIKEGLKHIIKTNNLEIKISNILLKDLADHANGDYRYAINVLSLLNKLNGPKKISKKDLLTVIPSMHFYSDASGDGHYDLLSAFHKSLRGSDQDAALYYLAQLLNSGDVLGMERRMIMVAYEDVGLAAPNLALRVSTGLENVKKVGFPEGRIILANLVIDICKSPKSNSSFLAIEKVQNELKKNVYSIPKHLQDSHYSSAVKLKRGLNYKYPHDYGGYVQQQYLPDEIKDKKFYKKNKNDKV